MALAVHVGPLEALDTSAVAYRASVGSQDESQCEDRWPRGDQSHARGVFRGAMISKARHRALGIGKFAGAMLTLIAVSLRVPI